MAEQREPQHPGREGSPRPGSHMLGPHVVGQRVVVRRLVPGETGPTGGPAMTDVLGVCRAWGPEHCEVEREDGTIVVVRLADVVSGKPVPPRPSVRHRVPVAEAERHTASLWPGLHAEPLGEWVLRTQPAPAGRPPKRANSCLAVGDPGVELEAALDAVRRFYRDRDRPALVHLESGSDLHARLLAGGWAEVPGGAALFLLAGTARALRAARRPGPGRAGAPIAVDLDEDGPRARATAPAGAARGAAALDGDWLGLHGLYVDPGHRRQGLGRSVVRELIGWGAERGATTVWLHVEDGNAAARSLYESLGFVAHHAMTYLRPPD